MRNFGKEFERQSKRIEQIQKWAFIWIAISGVVSLAFLAGLIFVIYKVLVHFGIL